MAREVTNAESVGVSTGNTSDGELRICVALPGLPINNQESNWVSLSPECARALFEQLQIFEHLMPPWRSTLLDTIHAESGAARK